MALGNKHVIRQRKSRKEDQLDRRRKEVARIAGYECLDEVQKRMDDYVYGETMPGQIITDQMRRQQIADFRVEEKRIRIVVDNSIEEVNRNADRRREVEAF